ncbi:MAG: hypothetical protein ACJ791_02360 [Gemmatimonadaceae bacterium]
MNSTYVKSGLTIRRRYNMLHALPQRSVVVAATLIVAISGPAIGQHSHVHADTAAAAAHGSPNTDDLEMAGGNGDWKVAAMAKHMAYSSTRPLSAEDSIRAAHIVNELRQAIARYHDVKAAEADGYKMFAPEIKNQPQYHFTRGWNAVRNQFSFDPARPTSLLYKKDERGELRLIGAMYTASKGTSEEELDQRIPLSVARWHRHVNWCIPPRSQKERWYETKNGRPVFGPLGVATEDACEQAGGRFIPQAFGWMVHVTTFAGNDLRSIWHDDHMEHDHAMIGTPNRP